MNSWLHHYTRLLVAATFLLIAAGGLVTTTDSGLAVPDWPLSYGQWMPPMVGGVFYEHLHRMIAGAVGFMTFILTLWVGFVEKRAWIRWLAILAFGAVVAQGILGGLTVLFLLPSPISIVHACLAQTFFTLVVCLAFFTSRAWVVEGRGTARRAPTTTLKNLMLMTTGLIYAQLILGAAVRHTDNQLVLVSHILGAFLVLIHVVLVLVYVFQYKAEVGARSPRPVLGQGGVTPPLLRNPAVLMGVVFVLQIGLGIGAFMYTTFFNERTGASAGEIISVTGHQTLGALMLATSAFMVLRIFRAEANT